MAKLWSSVGRVPLEPCCSGSGPGISLDQLQPRVERDLSQRDDDADGAEASASGPSAGSAEPSEPESSEPSDDSSPES